MRNKPKSRIIKSFLDVVGLVCAVVGALVVIGCVIGVEITLAAGDDTRMPSSGWIISVAIFWFVAYKLNKLNKRN